MERDDTIGSWSVDKLNLLRKYLQAYVTVLRKQSWCKGYEYIDGFAGTGRPKSRDEQRYVDGSPRVALELPQPFTKYHFIESSDWRVKKLEKLRKEFSSRQIEIYPGDCNEVLRTRIVPGLPLNSYKRAIAFLDPFGMELEWITLQEVALAETVEVFLNFSVMAINRNVRLRRKEDISSAVRERMDRFWGTEWEAELYEEERTLFGPQTVRIKQSGKELGERFQKRLKEIFPHCTVPVLMTNSKNAPLYCLVFAGHNETGVKIANNIFGKFVKMG
jgi:three-Cys-motif partner protein